MSAVLVRVWVHMCAHASPPVVLCPVHWGRSSQWLHTCQAADGASQLTLRIPHCLSSTGIVEGCTQPHLVFLTFSNINVKKSAGTKCSVCKVPVTRVSHLCSVLELNIAEREKQPPTRCHLTSTHPTVCFLLVWDRISCCSSGWPQTVGSPPVLAFK